MEILIFLLCLAAVVVVGWLLLVHWPRGRKTLDQTGLSKFFHGLILFGKDGSHVYLKGPSKDDRLVFTKRFQGENGWWLELSVAGSGIPASFSDDVSSSLETMTGRFDWKVLTGQDECGESRYSLSGSGLQDPAALEGAARLVVRCLGHPESTRFSVDFEGPKDYEAVDEYFGFKR